jgi:ribosome recycling factor
VIEDILSTAEQAMQNSLDALHSELQKIRTGRAHPSLLDHVTVDYYGNATPLNQVANITTEDARTLTVTPWEKNMVPVVEKAIMTADLGLNPNTAGQIIRIPMPPLTEERRKELIKVVKKEGDETKISIRNARRDANQSLKNAVKNKELTEDDQHKGEAMIQKITDERVSKVDEIVAEKEKELLVI